MTVSNWRFAMVLGVIFLGFNFLFAQSDIMESLKERFPDDDVAFDSFKTTFEYFYDANGIPKVKQTDVIQLVSLKSSQQWIWPVFYNDKIELGELDLRNEKGRKYSYEKFCSHQGQSGIFHSDAKLCTYSFYFPTSGTQLKLQSEITFKDPRYFVRVPIQEIMPGRKREVEFVWPEGIEVELKEFYLEDSAISKTPIARNGLSGFSYVWEWPKAMPSDVDMPHYSNYVPHIIPLTKSYVNQSDQSKVEVLRSTADLYDWYQELASGVDNNSDEVRNLVDQLTLDKSKEEKLESIYYWVQDNIKYIAFENGIMGFKPDDAGAVMEKKYGDCKGMANLLKAMLTSAGFDARLTWLGTNSLPYTYDIPSLGVDNHMVCTVISEDGDFVVLDATAKFNELRYHPFHIQGKQILIEQGDEFRVETIPFEKFENNYEKYVSTSFIEDGELVGDGELLLDGDAKQFFLMALSKIDKKDHARFTRSLVSYHGLTDGITTEFTESSRDEVVQIKVQNRFQNKIQSFGGELYVEFDLRKEFASLKMSNKRKAPFDFGRRRMVLNESSLTIPDGYKVQSLPESLTSANDNLEFVAKYEEKDGVIEYYKKLTIKKAILSPKDFSEWNESLEQLNTFYSQPIILVEND